MHIYYMQISFLVDQFFQSKTLYFFLLMPLYTHSEPHTFQLIILTCLLPPHKVWCKQFHCSLSLHSSYNYQHFINQIIYNRARILHEVELKVIWWLVSSPKELLSALDFTALVQYISCVIYIRIVRSLILPGGLNRLTCSKFNIISYNILYNTQELCTKYYIYLNVTVNELLLLLLSSKNIINERRELGQFIVE